MENGLKTDCRCWTCVRRLVLFVLGTWVQMTILRLVERPFLMMTTPVVGLAFKFLRE